MAGIPVVPEFEPDTDELYASTGGVFEPAPDATYYLLTKNDVEQLDQKFESWDYANQAANALNNGADDVDQNAWGVVEKTPVV